MEYITLKNGVEMPMVGFGTFPLTGGKLVDCLKITSKCGYELYDTAGQYFNEGDIGYCIKNGIIKRENCFLSSKVNWLQLRGRIRYLFLNRETVKSAYRHSCKRMNTDYLDLFLLHQPFNGMEKAYKEMIKLYEAGKVRAIGVCNFDIEELERLHDACGVYPMVNQTEISPRNSFKNIISFCKEHNIVVEAYSPFGRGNLVKELMNDPILVEIAHNHNKTVGQIVLRWIVQQGIVVIPRSTNESRIKENLNVFDFTLTDNEMSMIDSMNENRVYGVNQINKYPKNV